MGYADTATFQNIVFDVFLETELSVSGFLFLFLIEIET